MVSYLRCTIFCGIFCRNIDFSSHTLIKYYGVWTGYRNYRFRNATFEFPYRYGPYLFDVASCKGKGNWI